MLLTIRPVVVQYLQPPDDPQELDDEPQPLEQPLEQSLVVFQLERELPQPPLLELERELPQPPLLELEQLLLELEQVLPPPQLLALSQLQLLQLLSQSSGEQVSWTNTASQYLNCFFLAGMFVVCVYLNIYLRVISLFVYTNIF